MWELKGELNGEAVGAEGKLVGQMLELRGN